MHICDLIPTNINFIPNSDNNWDIEEENDDDDIDYSQFKGREGTIYLIDASIFDDGVENFKTLLDCVEAGLLNGVILNDKDLVIARHDLLIIS